MQNIVLYINFLMLTPYLKIKDYEFMYSVLFSTNGWKKFPKKQLNESR